MKKLFTIYLTAFALVIMLFTTSCKESTSTAQETITSAEDNAKPENEFASVFEYVNAEGTNNSLIFDGTKNPSIQETTVLKSDLLPDCATTTWDSVTRKLTIDFGTTDCLCKDGIYRRGKILANFNGKYKEIGSKVVVQLVDYYVNFKHYEGTKTIEKIGDYKWNIKVDNAKCITDEGTVSWSSERIIEKTSGQQTATIWDDTYVYTGAANGTNRNGVKFSVTIETPLKRKIQMGCFRNFVAGVLAISNDKGGNMTLNYDPIGGEPCDKIADVTINGTTKRITLR